MKKSALIFSLLLIFIMQSCENDQQVRQKTAENSTFVQDKIFTHQLLIRILYGEFVSLSIIFLKRFEPSQELIKISRKN